MKQQQQHQQQQLLLGSCQQQMAETMFGQQPDEQHIGRGSKRRPAANCHYDQLIGAIDQGTSSTRFLVFERGTGRLVASSQLEIKRITPREGWVEIDPNAIMSSVHATMVNVHEQLLAKQHQLNLEPSERLAAPCDTSFLDQKCASSGQQRPPLLKCIGICNQRESAVVWDSKTGQPLYNVIVWMDNRTKDIVDDMIDAAPGRDFNHLKDKTGLPMSTYFSAFKLRWLIDNVPEVQAALRDKRLLVGTVDSWILWNLTGKHLTDVTNASRTYLMDIQTLQWDKSLCKQFKVPMEILPKILASADHFGHLQFGAFMGTPITGVIGDQSAALFGHNCLQLGQTKATFGTGCFIMQNIGPGPLHGALSGVQREAKRGLITTVGYKLKDQPASYALEGSIKIAGAALTWLRDNMQLIQNYEECDQLVNATTNSAGVFFVPALGGLYSPYWDPNAAGLFIGLSQFTRREHLVRATFDAVAFQTNDILSLMHGVTNGLMIDGGLCKSDNLCQILADITGCDIVRPSMCETSALGAAMVAGYGAGIWDYDSMMAHSDTPHEYACSTNQTLHYPHETLNCPLENKYGHASLVQAQTQAQPQPPPPPQAQTQPAKRTFKSSSAAQQIARCEKSTGAAAAAATPGLKSPRVSTNCDQVVKQHRRSMRGRLMRNLDASGGINDDAGGGGVQDSRGGPAPERLDAATAATTATLPTVTENDAASPYENSQEAVELTSSGERAKSGVGAAHAPSSSGYSSCDNFELASSSCQLTDSMRLLDARTDSPVSQTTTADTLTTSDPNSLTNEAADESHKGQQHQQPLAKSSSCAKTSGLSMQSSCESHPAVGHSYASDAASSSSTSSALSFSLANYMSQQREKATLALNQLVGKRHEAHRTLTPVGPVQQVNNRKFAEKAQDVADEVQEFGGRDSYGEDGYDSSTISFDSYEDDDDDCDHEEVDSDDDDCGAHRDVELDPVNQTGSRYDVISNKSVMSSGRQRWRHASLAEKQMDVFQPYISLEHRTELVDTWRLAVTRSMQWTKVHHEEVRRIDYQRLSSLPISLFAFFSLGLLALSGRLSPMSLLDR